MLFFECIGRVMLGALVILTLIISGHVVVSQFSDIFRDKRKDNGTDGQKEEREAG